MLGEELATLATQHGTVRWDGTLVGRYGSVQYGAARFGMVRYGGAARYGSVWYHTIAGEVGCWRLVVGCLNRHWQRGSINDSP